MQNRKFFETTSSSLHIIAMALMLCDHLWGTVVSGNDWMTCLGRMTFPIFAFLAVEGYFHTSDFRKYMKRLFITALVSEIPFNLMSGGWFIHPFGQNVIWTFIISLAVIHINEKAKSRTAAKRVLAAAGSIVMAYLLGTFSFCDYGFAGVMTCFAFYVFRGESWLRRIGQLLALAYINIEYIGGYSYVLDAPWGEVFIPRQAFALGALLFIWLYKGKKGCGGKLLRHINYWFYPVHMAAIGLIGFIA